MAITYAARLNSFLRTARDVEEGLQHIASTSITHVDLNYPEHFAQLSPKQLGETLNRLNLKINCVAMRFRTDFVNGEYTNPDPAIRAQAIELTRQGIDAAAALGSDLVTIWLGFDGYDYSFQKDYAASVELVVTALRELADYRPGMRISYEYKPYEERSHSLIPAGGLTLHLLDRVDRDNVGVTLDFCHQLMAGETPAFYASLLLEQKKLYGIHLNDGNGKFDDGLMVGSVHPFETAELLYYLARYDWEGTIYFDTFPVREPAAAETQANVETVDLLRAKIQALGVEHITEVIRSANAIQSHAIRTALIS